MAEKRIHGPSRQKMSPAVLLTYLYFLQGLPYGLQARFLPIYFRAHGMSLSNIGFIKVLFFPWMCKTLWAPLVDRHGNKKTWLWWSMLGLAGTCTMTAGIHPDWLLPLCLVLLVFNLLTSTQDIATDGLAIEILTSAQVASGNIAQVVGYKLGAILGGGLLAWLSDHISWGTIFIFLTLIYVSAMFVVKWFVPDSRNHYFIDRTLDVPAPSKDALVSARDFGQYEEEQNSVPRQEFAVSDGRNSDSNEENFDDDFLKEDSPSRNTRSKTKLNSSTNFNSSSKYSTNADFNSSSARADKDSCNLKPEITDQYGGSSGRDIQSSPHSESKCSSSVKDVNSGCGGFCWMKDHFADVLKTDGTAWILVYVLVYKLGEQGALNMMPMLLVDGGVGTAEVGLWTGVVGQAVSITGSVLGGAAISSHRYTALRFLEVVSVVKVGVLAVQTLLVASVAFSTGSTGMGTVACVALMQGLLLVSGAVSTAAFTLMMQCSQRASPHCRASHYSLLATAEVLGKLLFSVFVGAITDMLGYPSAFGLFLFLSLVVLPLFWYAPKSLQTASSSSAGEEEGCDKHC